MGPQTCSCLKWLNASAKLGSIGNNDLLIAAITLAGLALFLPASRSTGELFFSTAVGPWAFGATLVGLILTVIATSFSTIISFWTLVATLVTLTALGSWVVYRRAKEREIEDESLATMAKRGRPRIRDGSNPPPPSAERCIAFVVSGERCVNPKVAGDYCKTHAKKTP